MRDIENGKTIQVKFPHGDTELFRRVNIHTVRSANRWSVLLSSKIDGGSMMVFTPAKARSILSKYDENQISEFENDYYDDSETEYDFPMYVKFDEYDEDYADYISTDEDY